VRKIHSACCQRSLARFEDAEANLCLKASISSSVSSTSSSKGDIYYQLLKAFKETHEEANNLALLNNRLKGLNNWLETRVKNLEEELDNFRCDFETLDITYKNSFCKCNSSFCENWKILENKLFYLVKIVDKLTKEKSNFESVPASQNCVFGKPGLGFNPQSKNNGFSKPFSTFAEKQSVKKLKQPIVSCFYCLKRGHFVKFCKARKILVSRGILRGIPKNLNGSYDQSNMKGLKFFKGSNLVI